MNTEAAEAHPFTQRQQVAMEISVYANSKEWTIDAALSEGHTIVVVRHDRAVIVWSKNPDVWHVGVLTAHRFRDGAEHWQDLAAIEDSAIRAMQTADKFFPARPAATNAPHGPVIPPAEYQIRVSRSTAPPFCVIRGNSLVARADTQEAAEAIIHALLDRPVSFLDQHGCECFVRPSAVQYVTDEGEGLSAINVLPAGSIWVRMPPAEIVAALFPRMPVVEAQIAQDAPVDARDVLTALADHSRRVAGLPPKFGGAT